MQFFLPLTTSPEQAERIHARIANRLVENGYQLAPHRILRVTYQRNGKFTSNAVGAPAHNGEIVLAISKNDVGYFICTYSLNAVRGEPITVRYASVESVEAFDENIFSENQPE